MGTCAPAKMASGGALLAEAAARECPSKSGLRVHMGAAWKVDPEEHATNSPTCCGMALPECYSQTA
eukprot:CAMPEP_0179124346 /NCGR_PEP_ID=MMETSP0796-20121207/58758_1 /TAXON_ID=73915 /ORGANISM="Pyrodinium bahamense, Strain pbaha01" /LENGTH=65 /DNA_ID=CAMNT_0020823005 /DNA_START=154 /DNA_END=352 /DNA_ORIENTATION=-